MPCVDPVPLNRSLITSKEPGLYWQSCRFRFSHPSCTPRRIPLTRRTGLTAWRGDTGFGKCGRRPPFHKSAVELTCLSTLAAIATVAGVKCPSISFNPEPEGNGVRRAICVGNSRLRLRVKRGCDEPAAPSHRPVSGHYRKGAQGAPKTKKTAQPEAWRSGRKHQIANPNPPILGTCENVGAPTRTSASSTPRNWRIATSHISKSI